MGWNSGMRKIDKAKQILGFDYSNSELNLLFK